MTVPMKQPQQSADIMEAVLLKGDLAKLTPQERLQYYNEVCRSLSLNPLTQPFAYITLNNKLQLYALRACTDQLRKVNNVTLEIVSREVCDDILSVHVRARLPDGRADEDLGAVAFPATLRGEARANAELKAVTKAKRRATLSICGLGWLDETEAEDIPAARRQTQPTPSVMIEPPPDEPYDQDTGEFTDQASPFPPHGTVKDAAPSPAAVPAGGAAEDNAIVEEIRNAMGEAARNGMDALAQEWSSIHPRYQHALVADKERWKAIAVEADQQRARR